MSQNIDNLFLEERRYPPPAAFAAQANADASIYDEPFEAFWEREARERVTWFEPFTSLYEWELPYAKWFLGGKLNVSYNCVDRHVEAGRGAKVAYYWEGEPVGDRRAITYADLQREVVSFANALKELGVVKGTAVAIYMGMVPDLAVAMLACTRLGAPHTVIFGGFSADSLSARMNDMGCEVLITQDEAWRRGSTVPLKRIADEAMADAPRVRRSLVVRRTGNEVPMTEGRDHWLHEVAERVSSDPESCPPEPMDSEDLLFLMYTSGTTAKPKGIAHTTGGYLVGVATTHRYVFDLKPERGRVLVRGRHRLDHRPQLHRLRRALQRHDERHVRGHARLPGARPLVGDRRALRGDDPLHGADGDPHAYEVGAGARAGARPVGAAAARVGGRADQPRGVGLVPREHRRRGAARSSTRGGRRRPARS